jgi:hypothetical protein
VQKNIELQEQGPAKYRHPNFNASKTPIGGKPVSSAPVRYNANGTEIKPQIGGQLKGPQPNKPKKKKPQQQHQSKPAIIEEIEQPTF